MCAARSRPFFLSLGTVTGERVPVTINGEPVEFDAPGFKGAFLSNYCEIRVSQIRGVKQFFCQQRTSGGFLKCETAKSFKIGTSIYNVYWGNMGQLTV